MKLSATTTDSSRLRLRPGRLILADSLDLVHPGLTGSCIHATGLTDSHTQGSLTRAPRAH
eukprot:1275846-Rhodomonas_salina.1